MRLYVLRHAEAADHAPTDAARELTSRGLEQARCVGAFCRDCGLTPDLVLTSPYRRTVQTAELLGAAFEQTPQTVQFLASGMHPATALHELMAYQRLNSLYIVGHQPDLGELVAVLLGLPDDEKIAFGKASLACLDVQRVAPSGASLRFFLPVELLP